MTEAFVSGALVVAYLVAALFFARFWRDTRDRLFAFFSSAFLVLAVQRSLLPFLAHDADVTLALYVLRALAFLVLAAGIVDKNRRG